jgi:hypothetical protein
VNVASEESDLYLWHCRYGHLEMDNVVKLANGDMVKGMDNVAGENNCFCEACVMGKQHRCLYPKGVPYRAR